MNTQHRRISQSYSAPHSGRCHSGKFISQSLNLLLPGVFPTPSFHQRKTISQDIQTPTPAFVLGLLQSPQFPVNRDYKTSPTSSRHPGEHRSAPYLAEVPPQQGKIPTRKTKHLADSITWRKQSFHQTIPLAVDCWTAEMLQVIADVSWIKCLP